MAAPDVVCQPCGSALGAPTKECSTAHKTLFLPKNGSRGAPTSVTRGRNGRRSPHSKHLTSTAQPLSRRIATSRPCAGAAVEKFSRAVVAPHRAVTRRRGREISRAVAPHRDGRELSARISDARRFGGAKMWLKKDLPDGRQVQRIFIPKGFDWVKTISAALKTMSVPRCCSTACSRPRTRSPN